MSVEKKMCAWIFVRGDSYKTLGNSPMLDGKPLIAYTIEAAKKSRYIKEVFVSTDSPDIAAEAEIFGATVPFLRPAALSGDIPVQEAWKHAIEWQNRNYPEFSSVFISLPVTTPLRTADEITQAIQLYLEGNCDVVVAVTRSNRHPAYDMVYWQEGDYASLIVENDSPFERKRKQAAYDITNLIFVSENELAMTEKNYLRRRVKAFEVPWDHCFDIRSKLELQFAELILKEGKK